MIPIFIFLYSFLSLAQKTDPSCPKYHQGYLLWTPSTKRISITQILPDKRSICNPFKDESTANVILEITLNQKQLLKRKIFIQSNVFWDEIQSDGTLIGGTKASQEIFFNTLIPENYQGSNLKIYDLKRKKILGEIKL
jgi:hypothetical protein